RGAGHGCDRERPSDTMTSMAAPWTPDERNTVEGAIKRHPAESGECAALARVIFKVGQTRDETTRGRQVRPAETLRARWIIPKHPAVRAWASHTFVETHKHAVDALAGADGCDPARYLQ